jgi:CheY-like chemotaxis protein
MATSIPPLAVLVVDDYPDTAESLAFFLRADGHEVRTATRAEEALALLDGWRPDAAILDIMLPGIDGIELAERLCEERQKRPLLVALSGSQFDDHKERVQAAGFDHHLLKPTDPCELADLLREHAAQRATI